MLINANQRTIICSLQEYLNKHFSCVWREGLSFFCSLHLLLQIAKSRFSHVHLSLKKDAGEDEDAEKIPHLPGLGYPGLCAVVTSARSTPVPRPSGSSRPPVKGHSLQSH